MTAVFGPIVFLYLFNKFDAPSFLFFLVPEIGFFLWMFYLLRED